MNDLENFWALKKSAVDVSKRFAEIEGNRHELVKRANGKVRGMREHIFCQAIFKCDWKQLKTIYRKKRRGRRRYQLCLFTGDCNQQVFDSAMYFDLPKKKDFP